MPLLYVRTINTCLAFSSCKAGPRCLELSKKNKGLTARITQVSSYTRIGVFVSFWKIINSLHCVHARKTSNRTPIVLFLWLHSLMSHCHHLLFSRIMCGFFSVFYFLQQRTLAVPNVLEVIGLASRQSIITPHRRKQSKFTSSTPLQDGKQAAHNVPRTKNITVPPADS